jgi:hypothetical protein
VHSTQDQVTDAFYLADEFCQEFSKRFERDQIGNTPRKHPRTSDSEFITILVLFVPLWSLSQCEAFLHS